MFLSFLFYIALAVLFFALISLAWPLRFVAEFALPLLMPTLTIWGTLRLSRWLITRV